MNTNCQKHKLKTQETNSLCPYPTSWGKGQVCEKQLSPTALPPTNCLSQQHATGWYLTFLTKSHYDVTCNSPIKALQTPQWFFFFNLFALTFLPPTSIMLNFYSCDQIQTRIYLQEEEFVQPQIYRGHNSTLWELPMHSYAVGYMTFLIPEFL